MGVEWRAWWALPWGEKLGLCLFMLGLPAISLGLHLRGYVRTRQLLLAMAPDSGESAAVDAATLARSERLAWLVGLAGRRGALPTTCLRQALLLEFLLRRRGLPAELRLGVRKLDGRFDAHAWVDLDGHPLGHARLDHAPLPSHHRPRT